MEIKTPGGLTFLSLLLISRITQGQIRRGERCTTPEGQVGECIGIIDCPSVHTLVMQLRNGAGPPNGTAIFRRSICSLRPQLVCCEGSSLAVRTDGPALQQGCGTRFPFADKIIDGKPSPLRAWPWMVILRGNTGGRSFWFCGGTLISTRYVLTAAHCFKEEIGINLEYARIGEHNLISEQDCSSGLCAPAPQDIPVEQIILHPSYDGPCNECHDIAVLKLSRDAVLDEFHVLPICLPVNPVRDMGYSEEEFQGKNAWAAGWGTTARDPSITRRPAILQQVSLPIEELPFCQQLKRNYPDPNMVLCAGGDGKDTCKGDSGGPLTLTDSRGLKHFIIGITSRGPVVCGSPNTQGLYTNVHYYVPWITSVIN